MMKQFKTELKNKILKSIYNDHGQENYDEIRFGEYPKTEKSFYNKMKFLIMKTIGYKKNEIANKVASKLIKKQELSWLYNNLSDGDKVILVEIIAYRLMGYKKVRLSVNNTRYHDAIATAEELSDNSDSINPNFMHFMLTKLNLKPIERDIQLYFSPLGVAIDYILEQYAYKHNGQNLIEAKPGDTVLDVGGCWGDTALYFADKVGINGKVYSFEFIPNNIALFNTNISLNPNLKSQITLIEKPVTNRSDDMVYYKDNGPGSSVKSHPFQDQTGYTSTVSIDDFVIQNNVTNVDFIKMDIEGAEPIALEGAINTIKKFKPKLAIAIYHSMDDFVNIPKWIDDLNLGYELHLAHYTIHAEETIIFANPKK